MSRSVGNRIITDGLVVTIDAGNPKSYNSGSAPNTVVNIANTTQSGSIATGIGYDGANGGSWVFDGIVNSPIDFGHVPDVNFDNTDPFSIDIWFKHTGTNDLLISQRRGSGDSLRGWYFDVAGGAPRFNLGNNFEGSAFIRVTVDDTSFSDSNWHHMTWTYDGSSDASGVNCYIDGNKKATTTNTNGLSATTLTVNESLLIGDATSGGNEWQGNISKASIYNRELTKTESNRNWKAHRNRHGL
jgi:hypothetical protein